MDSIITVIKELNHKGIFLYLRDSKLITQVKKGKVTNEIKETVKQNKERIISFLQKKICSLSYAQERLWFIDQYDHNSAYNMPGAIKLSGRLKIETLENTLSAIVNRHEILRTNFVTLNGVPKQVIHADATCKLKLLDFSQFGKEQADQQVAALIEKESQKPFDLEKDSLISVILYKINEEEHVLFMNKHHIISDGWSFSVLFKEISLLYESFVENKSSPLVELAIQYADYALWQREYLQGELLEKQSDYWKTKLAGLAVLELPTDHLRAGSQTFNGNSLPMRISRKITQALNQLSKDNNVTLFMSLLSVFKVFLHRYTGEEDICVGTPIANRTRSEVEGLIGFFVNTLALRDTVDGEESFIELLERVKRTTLEAYEHQDMPFERVVNIVDSEKNFSYSPLFQVMLILQNNPKSELEFSGLKLNLIEVKTAVSKFDLTFEFTETTEGLVGKIEYNTDLFNEQTIERMLGHFMVLVESVVEAPEKQIKDLQILSGQEEQQLLSWNNTSADYPKDKCIHALFEEQVERTPDNVALVYEDTKLTFRELNEKANIVANYLRNKYNLKPDDLVGILLDRSPMIIISMLGILKAGGAYVPIDSEYPEDRINYIIKNSAPKLVICDHSEGIFIDIIEILTSHSSFTNPDGNTNPNNLAYVIYTSGSTGLPKGSLIEHKNVVRLIFNDKFQFSFSEKDVWSLFHSFCFDFSVWEMYGALLYGGKLIIIPKESTKDIGQFCRILKDHEVTVLNQTPSVFYNLSDFVSQNKIDLSVRYVIFGGEALAPVKLKYWYENFPACKLINMYGITETTVHVTLKEVTEVEINNNICNIGKPIPTLSTYILDKNKKLVPIGVPGELCVSGAGVSRGYLNNEVLTQKKFQENPFVAGEKLYMSGDSAYLNEQGELIYCGRIDDQVKIRGFRIELGEIESALNKLEEINTSVVLATEDKTGNKRLVAYIVPANEAKESTGLNIEKLRADLSKGLPDYMVPSLYVRLETIPLTLNGKVNKKFLPEPDGNIETTREYAAPQTDAEKKLAQIWKDALGVEKVGILHNFFELGGHSLLAAQVVSKINKNFGCEIRVPVIFQYPTIKLFSEYLAMNPGTEWTPLAPVKINNSLQPLYFIPGQACDVTSLQLLSKYLESNHSVYGFQYAGMDPGTKPLHSIEDIATQNIEALKKIQPTGPYILCGYSFGGFVAFEMAKQLIENEDIIENIYLFDTPSPEYFNRYKKNQAEGLLHFVKSMESQYNIRINLNLDNLKNISRLDFYNAFKEAGEKYNRKELVLDFDDFNRRAETNDIHFGIVYNPTKKLYNIPITLFRAEKSYQSEEPTLGWSSYSMFDISIRHVPGDHHTMMLEPCVKVLGMTLTEEMAFME